MCFSVIYDLVLEERHRDFVRDTKVVIEICNKPYFIYILCQLSFTFFRELSSVEAILERVIIFFIIMRIQTTSNEVKCILVARKHLM